MYKWYIGNICKVYGHIYVILKIQNTIVNLKNSNSETGETWTNGTYNHKTKECKWRISTQKFTCHLKLKKYKIHTKIALFLFSLIY